MNHLESIGAEIDTTPGLAAKISVRCDGEEMTVIPKWLKLEAVGWFLVAECVETRRVKYLPLRDCDFRETEIDGGTREKMNQETKTPAR